MVSDTQWYLFGNSLIIQAGNEDEENDEEGDEEDDDDDDDEHDDPSDDE
jgi:hypothetical protein